MYTEEEGLRGEDDEEELRAKRCRAGRGLSARPPPPPTAYLQLLPNTVFSFSLSHSHSLTVKSLRSSQGFTLKPYALKPFFFCLKHAQQPLQSRLRARELKAQAQGSSSRLNLTIIIIIKHTHTIQIPNLKTKTSSKIVIVPRLYLI